MNWSERIVVNAISLSVDGSLESELATFADLGVRRIGLSRGKIHRAGGESAVTMIERSGLMVDYLLHRSLFDLRDPARWPDQVRMACHTVDLAVAMGVPQIYLTTGTAGDLDPDEAVDRLVGEIPPVVEHARAAGVQLLFETTNDHFGDIDILHTLRDTLAVARRCGIGVCVDLYGCWAEHGVRATLSEAAPLIGLVQVSDYVSGCRTMDRAVPGDGVIPIERLLRQVLAEGYAGQFDLELYGDQGMPDTEAIRLSMDRLTEMLERIG
ncbi:TIM barrel protein [Nakamurella sp. YIM 132087]|uniref:TIM barrel protein n=1 Tax=Nakamurella alba TaxID=2665158 RepID=A0A7K1FH94_9ACTN|nr:sugar phosphate isomerase/epimerase family protein [Nakamurella alba]MTD13436.1 TIM barrel protein [Nakamurella alba]